MLWLDKMDHMTQLARQMQITDWTLDDDWFNVITWQATPCLPVAKNRLCWPTDLVNEAKKADLQKYIFEVTKCQFNGLKLLECQTRYTMHNYNTRCTCHTNFKWFAAPGAEFCPGQNLSARPPERPSVMVMTIPLAAKGWGVKMETLWFQYFTGYIPY